MKNKIDDGLEIVSIEEVGNEEEGDSYSLFSKALDVLDKPRQMAEGAIEAVTGEGSVGRFKENIASGIRSQFGTQGPVGSQDIVGGGVDIITNAAIDPLTYLTPAGVTKGLKSLGSPFLEKKAIDATSRLINQIGSPDIFTKIGGQPKIDGIAKTLQDTKINKYRSAVDLADNPDRLKEFVSGSKKMQITPTPEGGYLPELDRLDYVRMSSGEVGRLAKEVDDFILRANQKAGKILDSDIVDDFNNIINSKMSTTGSGFDPKQALEYGNTIKRFINFNPQKVNAIPLKKLNEIKREVGASLHSDIFKKVAEGDPTIAVQKEAVVDLYKYLKNKIVEKANSAKILYEGNEINAGDLIDLKNQRATHLYDLVELMESSPATRKGVGATLPSMAIGGAAGAAVGASFPLLTIPGGAAIGAGLGGGLANLRNFSNTISTMWTKYKANYFNNLAKGGGQGKLANVIEGASAGLMTPEQAEEIVDYEIDSIELSRDPSSLFQNSDMMLAKIERQAPELLELTEKAMITKNEDQLKKIMQQIAFTKPELFEYDKYGRFDGKVPLENMANAQRDLLKDPTLGNFEKFRYINDLNKFGIMKYTPRLP